MKFRWRIAYALNRFQIFCWTRLVTWALDGGCEEFKDIRVDSLCHRDAAENGTCYCGKLKQV